jgi:hypothetical protein
MKWLCRTVVLYHCTLYCFPGSSQMQTVRHPALSFVTIVTVLSQLHDAVSSNPLELEFYFKF